MWSQRIISHSTLVPLDSPFLQARHVPLCSFRGEQYNSTTNETYNIYCGLCYAEGAANDVEVTKQRDLRACLDRCSIYNQGNPSKLCVGAVHRRSNCYLKSIIKNQRASRDCNAGMKFSPGPPGTNCPVDTGHVHMLEPSQKRHAVRCQEKITDGVNIRAYREDFLEGCMSTCSDYNIGFPELHQTPCRAVTLFEGKCYLKSGLFMQSAFPLAIDSAVLLDEAEFLSLATPTPTPTMVDGLESERLIPTTTEPPRSMPGTGCPTNREGQCRAGSICCNDRFQFSICTPNDKGGTSQVYFGLTAEGTYCDQEQNQIRAVNNRNCSPDGHLVCSEDGTAYMRCDQGGHIGFGQVADGTRCLDGAIVAVGGI